MLYIKLHKYYQQLPENAFTEITNGQLHVLYRVEALATSVEQMAIFATCLLNNMIQQHYQGIIPVSQIADSHLNLDNLLKAIKKVPKKFRG